MSQAVTSASAIPFKQDDGRGQAVIENGAIAILVLSFAVIGIVLFVRKRLKLAPMLAPMRLGMPRHVSVLESTRLGPKTMVSVVEFDGTRYLVAHGDHGTSCLASAKRDVTK